MPKLGGERYSVQNPIISYVREPSAEYRTEDGNRILLKLGWEYVSPDEALRLRGGKTGIIFRDIFVRQVRRLNPFIDDEQIEELIRRIERIPPNIEGNLIAWEYLKGLRTIYVPDEKRERNVRLIDAENVDSNTFHVTDEFEFTNGTKTIRPDVVFLINGVPVFLIETKAAHKIDGMSEAFEQIKRYHRECPELLAILQIYAITHIIRYYYGPTWNTSIKGLFNYKDEMQGDFESLVKSFLDRKRVIRVLTDFILFTTEDDEMKKVVLRPHQMRAVDKIIKRAHSERKRGLIWHTQGSGKTYTMIVAAKTIIENPIFNNPTVLMLVDRNELETQLFGNIRSLGIKSVEVAGSKRELKELLRNDKKGLIVSMIHKFEGMPPSINTKENLFVLIDEAHRTTGGDLGNYLMGALPNATYIGFTGTPIDKTSYGKGTFIVFGKDDPPHGYLDKYSIAESIEDGTTVPLHYALAPNELRVEKEILEREFLNLAEAQGVSDVESLNRVLEKAVNLRNMLKNPERREKVIKYIVHHYREYIEPMGYKAFIVAVDREACAFYKEELDKYLPPEYSEVVYSRGQNDKPPLTKYHLSPEKEKQVRKAFRKPDAPPKILIVTEKLLTGFDAPILYCMYLDKPMRDHVLLQAIARVNRPYEDETGRNKPAGFVLDFVGIFDNLEKALAFDSSDVEGVVHDIQVLRERFSQEMEEAQKDYLTLISGMTQDKAVEAVLEHFRDEERRHEFYQFFKELSNIYEILSPDAFLRPYIEDMETLARMYRIVREAYDPGTPIEREFTRKVARLVQEHTKSGPIKPSLEIYEINEKTIEKIEESKASNTEKVFNLIRSIEKAIQENRDKSYLLSIAEKAELVAEMYRERQKTTQETLEELKKIIEEMNEANREKAKRKMPDEVFTVFWHFRQKGLPESEKMAKRMLEVFEEYPHWKRSERQEKEVRSELYKVMFNAGLSVSEALKMAKDIMRVLKRGEGS